jgi:hypothetical protein
MSRVNVDFEAFTDTRFVHLAILMGFADHDHARSKVEYLWQECTLRGTTKLPQWLVDARLGDGGSDALIKSELARWAEGRGDSKTRLLHICGAGERCLWLANKQGQSAKGGKSRASRASRTGGKFAIDTSQSPASPGDGLVQIHQPEHQPKPALLPPSSFLLPPEEERRGESSPPPPEIPAAKPARSVPITPDPRVKINHDAWRYAYERHCELRKAGIGSDSRAWPPLPVGAAQHDLVEITRELTRGDLPDFDGAAKLHRHRVDVLVAECRRENHLRWFTPSRTFDRVSWWRAVEITPEEARRRRAPAITGADPPRLRAPALDEEEAS